MPVPLLHKIQLCINCIEIVLKELFSENVIFSFNLSENQS